MSDLKSSTAAFTANLLRVKSMAVTSAVILGCTFLPIAGGAPKLYELREVSAWITGDSVASRAIHPDWGGMQAQTISVVDSGVRMTAAAFVPEAAAAEVEQPGDDVEQLQITPVVQIVEGPPDVCAEACDLERPVVEDEAIIEPSEFEELEEMTPPEMG
jgi:hypothetical protein